MVTTEHRMQSNNDLILLPILGHEKIYVIGRLISVSYTLASSSSWESEDGVS